ncbi:fused response regulator/phosphatase [Alteromonas sp. ALT199]|uniref:ATP-binding SpoIIE family protein phosphatase n=1 Tax=unclassified Alteromonas TaxID=2614992 RepID=UPI001BE5E51F|nr:fused response regulator/phosphatase [Alteromonas sp. ALT199]MBT3136076.1 fused response regulator/phosphatase [Alteromonas sp. ALT199]
MKILIVDDEAINRTLLTNMLYNAGFKQCIEAVDGIEAIKKFTDEQPDLVLLDVVMPGLSGFDVAPKIRKLAKGPYLPILFITALEDKDSLVRCLEVGGNDFVTKPFDRHILTAKINAHLKIRGLSEHVEEQNKTLRFFNQRVAREHAIVEHIFSHAIVNRPEVLAHFDCYLKPAETFNGDLFLCEASPSGGIYFIVGDFTGHGLASAIGALPLTRAFQELTQQGVSISEIVSELNRILIKFLPSDMFMAAVIGEINSAGNRINLWQGGMPAVFVPSVSDATFRKISSRHMALGILDEHELNTDFDTINLGHNEQLIICSDGLIEIANDDGDMLLEEGLVEIIKEQMIEEGVIDADLLFKRAKAYGATSKFQDDVTLVVFTSKHLNISTSSHIECGLPSVHEVVLNAEHLKQPDIQQRVLQLAGKCEGIQSIRSVMFTVLSELFNNALEHGILKMDSKLKNIEGFNQYYEKREASLKVLSSGRIIIRIESLPEKGQVLISVEDSGKGFQWENKSHLEGIRASDNECFGRGLPLINALCERVWFENEGSRVICLLNSNN